HDAAELDNRESLIDKCDIKQTKTLYVIYKSGKFACLCGFYVIRGHDCQDIVAVRLFIDKVKLQNQLPLSAHANGHKKDELKLPKKRGPKNKRKNRLVPGESIYLQGTILNIPYKNVKIVEIIGESRVIVDIIFEDDCSKALTQVFGSCLRCHVRGQVKPISSSKDSYGNVVIFTIPYGEKKDTLYLTSTCP
ncbi:35664_t:CDS:2, partial [Racocetra persica]